MSCFSPVWPCLLNAAVRIFSLCPCSGPCMTVSCDGTSWKHATGRWLPVLPCPVACRLLLGGAWQSVGPGEPQFRLLPRHHARAPLASTSRIRCREERDRTYGTCVWGVYLCPWVELRASKLKQDLSSPAALHASGATLIIRFCLCCEVNHWVQESKYCLQ